MFVKYILGIYIGYKSLSILKYLESLKGNLFTARFVDWQFDKAYFLTLRGEKAPDSSNKC